MYKSFYVLIYTQVMIVPGFYKSEKKVNDHVYTSNKTISNFYISGKKTSDHVSSIRPQMQSNFWALN